MSKPEPLKVHPYTSAGPVCSWCGEIEDATIHKVDGIGPNTAFITGSLIGTLWKVGAEEGDNGFGLWHDVVPELDTAGNYTNRIHVTTKRGTKIRITVEVEEEDQ